jgi:hypothetical protein
MSAGDDKLMAVLDRAAAGPSSEALPSALAAAQAELLLQPVARAWWLDALAIVGANLVVCLGAAVVLGGTGRSGAHTSEVLAASAAALMAAVLLVGAVAAIAPRWRWARLLLIPLALVAGLSAAFASSGFDPGLPFARGIGCTATECVMALVPLSVSLFALTRFAASALRSAVVGLSAGAGGVLAVHLHCPNGTLSHLLVFHLLPWAALAGLAVLVRRRLPSRSVAP